MKYLKNKTVIGILAIVFGLLVVFIISPLYNRALEAKTKVVRVVNYIERGSQITSDDIKIEEVGSYNIQAGVYHAEKDVIGKYAAADLYKDENIINSKLSDTPLSEDEYLEGMDGTKGAMSITLQSFAAGLSGKLLSGDIVSIIATDANTKETKVLPELMYVKVLASTTQKGKDVDDKSKKNSDTDEDNLPVTVTIQVNRKQALAMANIEQLEKSHLELVFRGTEEDSKRFLDQQDKIINEMEADPLLEDSEDITTKDQSADTKLPGDADQKIDEVGDDNE
ncbi:RcpC/CpaB family pilus assembly protein [Anaerocolumna sp. AGMB13020]|uniref:Flp pilus assembly protein CpaB n=1 Tax=Anaerocolumna sp. AGMB13020 TaxID=3081750 RepID=UPI002954B046|nr:RcpC/CpaB family pilus assembly protein [Anaerocolumna sp. AGMB13020]WOO35771.1 RcpC/CpaB family pilus assembly protein [Anaerocolumna sp. AGMB13020]